MSTIRQRLSTYKQSVLTLDGKHFDRLFTICLLISIGGLLALTPQYRESSQLFPLTIGIPSFGLLLLLLAVQISSRIRKHIDKLFPSDLFVMNDHMEMITEENGKGLSSGTEAERYRVIIISIWIFVLFILIFVIGIPLGILLFMITFYRIQADQNWLWTLIYTSIVWVSLILIFDVIINTPLYQGLLGIWFEIPI